MCLALLPPAGAWACTAVRMIAENLAEEGRADKFCRDVRMWVYEEEVEGRWVPGPSGWLGRGVCGSGGRSPLHRAAAF